MRKDLMNNNQHHYLNELNFPTNRDLKNLFGSFYNLLDLPESRDVSSWNNFEPKLEVKENKESVNVTAEIPGMNENDIDLQLSEDGYLTISGEKKNSYENKEGGSYFSETATVHSNAPSPCPGIWTLTKQTPATTTVC